ncbi:hypothetical protein PIB30_022005 [Stylosanthes scabra]|uniref:Uncharacterized protein n=1 Tax=Stylosanthes scabra TaxID=79078 RepID=A0ABU6X841_9FABA|nr:hypothetical protein [Stylosanthes scabra]
MKKNSDGIYRRSNDSSSSSQTTTWSMSVSVQIKRRPKSVKGARPLGVEAGPWLPAAGPMQEAHRPSVEVPAASLNVITSQSMLVPPVLDGRHVSRKHQKERRQRP